MLKFTNEDLAKTVTERVKITDTGHRNSVAGLYASKTPNVCTFSFRYYDRTLKKQKIVEVGRFHSTLFNIDHARAKARENTTKVDQRVDLRRELMTTTAAAANGGKTFNQVADAYIAYVSTLEKKKDGAMRARKESWDQDVSNLTRPRAAFGTKVCADVNADDVQALLNSIMADGRMALSINVRVTLTSLFKWAVGPGRRFIPFNPITAGTLDKRPKQKHKTRFLTREELRTFWHGLDRDDLPCDRRTALTFKLILATMLRPGEVLSARRSEIKIVTDELGGDGKVAYMIPMARVKKRRVIIQPMNTLAMEIVAELMAMDTKRDMLIPPGAKGAAMSISNLATALRGRQAPKVRRNRKTQTKDVVGLCEFLGLAPFTAHDLRRTSTTHLGLGLKGQNGKVLFEKIARTDTGRCLDHQPEDAQGATIIYDVSEQVLQTEMRRVTLDHLDGLLRTIVGRKAAANVVPLRKAA